MSSRQPSEISDKSKGIKKQYKNKRGTDSSDDEEVKEENVKTIIVIGSPGAGKSNFCNFMLDGRASGRFVSSSECVGGVTRNIKSEINWALNI